QCSSITYVLLLFSSTFFFLLILRPPISTLFPYTTLFRSLFEMLGLDPIPPKTDLKATVTGTLDQPDFTVEKSHFQSMPGLYVTADRKSTRLNSSHVKISYAVFCLKKKKKI